MRARLPGIRLGCRRYIGLLMTRVSCDSWNVLFCLENMVFLVLVSVNVELGGGYLRIFPLYSEKYNGLGWEMKLLPRSLEIGLSLRVID